MAFQIAEPFIIQNIEDPDYQRIREDCFYGLLCIMTGLTGIHAPITGRPRRIFTLEQDKSQFKGYMFASHVDFDMWRKAHTLEIGDKVDTILSYPAQNMPPHAEIYAIEKVKTH